MKQAVFLFLVLVGNVCLAQQAPIEVAEGHSISIKTSAICEMCKEAIEYDLVYEKGVKSSDLDLDNKVVTVVYNPKKTDAETIRKRITKVGYHADDLIRDPRAYENLPFCCKDGAHDTPIPQVPLKSKGGN
jgi:mercuric ion binding protein